MLTNSGLTQGRVDWIGGRVAARVSRVVNSAVVALVAILTAGCQPRAQPEIDINSSGTHTYSIFIQRAGQPQVFYSKLGKSDGLQYSPEIIRQGKCEDAKLIIVRDDGRTINIGPPLCAGKPFELKD